MPRASDLAVFLVEWRAWLEIESGAARGLHVDLSDPELLVGKGPGVDLASRDVGQGGICAVVAFESNGFALRDTEIGAAARVNGAPVTSHRLEDGDEIQVGRLRLRYRVERRTALVPERGNARVEAWNQS